MEKDIFQKLSKSVGCKYMNIITRNQLRLRRLHFEPKSYLRKNKNKESVICSGMKSQQLLKLLLKIKWLLWIFILLDKKLFHWYQILVIHGETFKVKASLINRFIIETFLSWFIASRILQRLGKLSEMFNHRHSLTEAATERRYLQIAVRI